MKIIQTPLQGLLIIEPTVFMDNRGYFFEAYQREKYQAMGIPEFLQDNTALSQKNVLRGLHFQLPHAQGKLVSVSAGDVFDVAVDLRRTSPTFGKWFGVTLNSDNHRQLYIPDGFAHGYCTLTDNTVFHYKCTALYQPQHEHGIAWNDTELAIDWPVTHPILSAKDAVYPSLRELAHDQLFT